LGYGILIGTNVTTLEFFCVLGIYFHSEEVDFQMIAESKADFVRKHKGKLFRSFSEWVALFGGANLLGFSHHYFVDDLRYRFHLRTLFSH